MPCCDRLPLPTRNLLYIMLALLLSAAACGSSDSPVSDAQSSSASAPANDESAEVDGDETDTDTDTEADTEGRAENHEASSGNADESNPAAADIRDLIGAQSSLYGWDKTQRNCIADGVIATGEAGPGDLANDVYAGIITGCSGMRGQLEFAMTFVMDAAVATCVVDELSDDQVNVLGTTVLVDSFEGAEAAMKEEAANHPECG